MPPRRMCAKKIPAIHTSEQAPARSGLELRLNLGGERYHWNRFHTIENDNQFLDLTGGDFACAEPEHHRHHRYAVHEFVHRLTGLAWGSQPHDCHHSSINEARELRKTTVDYRVFAVAWKRFQCYRPRPRERMPRDELRRGRTRK